MSLFRSLREHETWFTGREDTKEIAAKTKWTGRPWGSRGINWTHGGRSVKTCVLTRKCRQCSTAMRRGEF